MSTSPNNAAEELKAFLATNPQYPEGWQTKKRWMSEQITIDLPVVRAAIGNGLLYEMLKPELFPGIEALYAFFSARVKEHVTGFLNLNRGAYQAGEPESKARKKMAEILQQYFKPSRWKGKEVQALAEFNALLALPQREEDREMLHAIIDLSPLQRAASAHEKGVGTAVERLLKKSGANPGAPGGGL